MKDPTEPRPYLADPNYYRLAYQLAAQLLNGELARRYDQPSLSADEAVSERLRTEDPVEAANDVLRQARVMLRWYRNREEAAHWWRPWGPRKLEPRDLRLRRFLSETVEPCAELVAAGALANRGRREDAERRVSKLRKRAGRRQLSYRAFYNLACYETTMGAEDEPTESRETAFRRALEALSDALDRVHGRRRDELLRWADKDPSLQLLRSDHQFGSQFQELLGSHRIRETDPDAKATEQDVPPL